MKENFKQTIHVFDVDGTLTHHDSFIELLRYFIDRKSSWINAWVIAIPTIIKGIFKGDLSNAKLLLLKRLWKGKKRTDIYRECSMFFINRMQYDIRLKAISYINNLKQTRPEEKLVLLSASCSEWLKHLSNYLKADLVCTELEYDSNEIFTGRYATPNCKGKEKIRRLIEKYPNELYEFICYGNSATDKVLKSVSKEFHYRYF